MELKTPESEEKQNGGSGGAGDPERQSYWTFGRIATVVGIIEGISGVVWMKSADFVPALAYYIQWFAYGGMISGIAFGAHKLRGENKKLHAWVIWVIALLFWIALLFSKSAQSTNTVENKLGTWQPPELPDDCKDVVIWFGSQGMTYKMDQLTNYPFAPGVSTSVPISNLPEGVRTNLPNIPGFSPHLKDVLGLFVASNYINGKTEDYYPALPQVVSNRLYVFVKIPLTNYQRIVMSDEMDSILTNCLPQSPDFWDWNYSRNPKTNVFEIVNENKNPIVQVIYKSPREVLVNGVFFVSHYDIQATFDGKQPGFFSIPNVKTNMPADSFGIVLTNEFGGIISTNQPKPGKHEFPIYQVGFGVTNLIWLIAVEDVYAGFATNQKSIFKYPSNVYPGEFSDYCQRIIKDEEASAELADAVILIVVGGGFLWMCFGWIFFQKWF